MIRLSLLEDAERFDDDQRLAAAIGALLAPYGRTAPGTYRFLVVDTPEGLVHHQSVYERLLRYQRAPRISLLCVLAGDLRPGSGTYEDSPMLRLPGMLRTTSVGVLWTGDIKAAGRHGPPAPGGAPDPLALGALTGLLLVPELFDQVLRRLGATCNGVAAPGARLLEYDLSPTARDRAWKKGAARFVGQPSQGAGTHVRADGVASGASSLPEPLDRLADGSGAQHAVEYTRGGPLEETRNRCVAALRDAGQAKNHLATVGGLVAGHGAEAFSMALVGARTALGEYREQVSDVVELGARPQTATEPAEAGLRLKELGLTLPPAGITPEQSGEGLRELAERLFGAGLTLSGVADRFEDCSARMMPYQDDTLTEGPARACPQELLAPGGGGPPHAPSGAAGARVLTFLAGALAGLGVWPWAAGAVGVLLLAVFGASLISRHLPNSAPRVRAAFGSGYSLAQGTAALLGGASAAALGTLLGLPTWTAPIGLPGGLVLAWIVMVREWNRAVRQVWKDSGAAALQGAVRALDEVLDQAVRQRWWAEPERTGCAEAARSVSVVLSGVSATVTAEAAAGVRTEKPAPGLDADGEGRDPGTGHRLDVPAWMPRAVSAVRPGSGTLSGAGPVPARPGGSPDDRTPPWVDRENGDGGPDLVATLGGDFADLVVQALEPYWESVKGGHSASGAAKQVARRVRELLDVARRHLLHNGVIPAPPYADPKRTRSGPAGLLGLGLDRVVEVAAPNADRDLVVQLVSPGQLPLLSRDPTAVEWIRFAPAAVRDQVDGHAADDDGAVWTYSGRYAGQLRLTPLRAGSVETLMSYGGTRDPDDRHTGHPADGRPVDEATAPAPEGKQRHPANDPLDEEHSW
ncbi:hypothetical protein ADK57_28765 [Streptomyces sp. MMG1533]|uniref:hypothetical protein n=1 Tax=Streptomyces sp. MMG1533 TaxID=1415546 RepID=UPI0006AF67D8|nr:hypothetical protein [Streptomyces sp. MMG1533]KOU61116.1 hypothetical protein ADK57_28765 [Streptomyces sp. MMG1533]